MSTRLTRRGIPMEESDALQLGFLAAELHENITESLAEVLTQKGYEGVSSSSLSFLSALDCGENYGSEIARSLGVSRQMVAKTVKEMVALGYLEQADGVGKQKLILFTERGELLMSDARKFLASVDDTIKKKMGARKLKENLAVMRDINAIIQNIKS